MKMRKSLPILALALLASACNERISPELMDGASLDQKKPDNKPDPDKDPDPIPTFEIKDVSPTLYNYQLHKTGLGNKKTPCKITNEKFSHELFSTIPGAPANNNAGPNPTFDISCFLEAEEFSLYYGGLDLMVKASPDLCEYVAFEPYRFYQYQPGSSTRTINQIKCEGVDSNIVRSLPLTAGDTSAPAYGAGCNDAFDTDSAVTSRDFSQPTNLQDLCSFDYSGIDGPNCDEGTITGTLYTYFSVEVEVDDGMGGTTQTTRYRRTPVPINHKCGGKAFNCLKGAGLAQIETGKLIDIERTIKEEKYEKTYSFTSPYSDNFNSNVNIANYVRQCSGPINNNDSENFKPIDTTEDKDNDRRNFDPLVLDRYANKRQYWTDGDGTTILSTKAAFGVMLPVPTNVSKVGMTKTYYAADSLMSAVDPIVAPRTAPYYTFFCLNSSREIKARIKLAVRDWDRAFSVEKDDIELLSDIFQRNGSLSSSNRYLGKMDTDSVELPEDDNPFNDFNDINDWDDFLDSNRKMNHSCSAPADPIANPWFSNFGFIRGKL